MNLTLIIAGFLTASLGVMHSYFGEQRFFPDIESKRGIASEPLVSVWQLRLLRGTWHTLSLFGFGLGAVLVVLAVPELDQTLGIERTIAIACAVIGMYWACITRFWHLPWLAFIIVAALCWFA
jgi:alpha-beta hydrolase superfamily lysophospholipase